MAVRPEHLKRRIARAKHEEALGLKTSDLAADILEAVIDEHLRANAGQLANPGVLLFALASGTDSEVVSDVIGRYRSVGWNVERESTDTSEALSFRIAPSEA